MKSAKDRPIAPIFAHRIPKPAVPSSSIPSSSPAFGTPIHPLRPFAGVAPAGPDGAGNGLAPGKPAVLLPILLPAATLRPLAFRTFTKKHSLTLTSSALQELATFVGRHCGAGWREEGLADRVLEEVARGWKARNGGVIVDGSARELAEILKTLEGNMRGGKVMTGGGRPGALSRQGSLVLESAQAAELSNTRLGLRPTVLLTREDSSASFGVSALEVEDDDVADEEVGDVRKWLRIINALEQPRMVYNVAKKHFERDTNKPSLFPPATHKTLVFRNRYNVIHQRLLRNEFFQTSAVASARGTRDKSIRRSSLADATQGHRITPISNLLGRHGTHHMLLGMLTVLPSTGGLAFGDPSGTIALDVSRAVSIPDGEAAWFCPGMIVLVDGVYEEDEDGGGGGGGGRGLNGTTGIGGVLGGRFQAFFIGQPPCERRRVTLGSRGADDRHDLQHAVGGGFGWVDFLGVGSERAVGSKMRKLEQRLLRRQQSAQGNDIFSTQPIPSRPAGGGRHRIVVVGELNLDNPRCLQALRKILSTYACEPEGATPMAFVLMGNFTTHAVLGQGGAGGGSIEYKEAFDALASTLADFPMVLRAATFVLVPGDNDGWVSAFTAGAAAPLPRKPVPDLFTSRVRRTFTAANAAEAGAKGDGEVVWTTNPSRMALFGPQHEIVLFRDDMSARFRRSAVRLKGAAGNGKKGGDDDNNDDDNNNGDDVEMSETTASQLRSPSQPTSQSQPQSDSTPDPSVEAMDLDGDPLPSVETQRSPPPPPPPAAAISHDVKASRRLVKTVLDQGFLAPFRQPLRPVHWDFAGALQLYPLPTAMVLADTSAPPFCTTYEGCHVMNPGALLVAGRRGVGRWVEWAVGGVGTVRECSFG